jgi:hypothetical protein
VSTPVLWLEVKLGSIVPSELSLATPEMRIGRSSGRIDISKYASDQNPRVGLQLDGDWCSSYGRIKRAVYHDRLAKAGVFRTVAVEAIDGIVNRGDELSIGLKHEIAPG